MKGSKKTIAKKIYKAQSKEDKKHLTNTKLNPNKMEFIVKGNEIYVADHSVTYSYAGYTFLNPVKIEK